MRKFRISNPAARRMQGLEETAPGKTPGAAAGAAEAGESTPGGNGAGTAGNGAGAASPAGAGRMPAAGAWEGLRVTSRTDVGLVRKNNQDTVIRGQGLIGVADGMGGHRGGEIASAGARDGLYAVLQGKKPDLRTLESAVKEVNLELWQRQEADDALSGMGTTLSVLWPADDRMLIAHVGDSRVYLLREGELRQVTQDHSMVADLVRKGLLTEEQAAVHPMRNYITRAVATEPGIRVDMLALERAAGDRWLICSDGLHGLSEKEELRRMLLDPDLEEAADRMMRLALDRGGRDNISLVLAEDVSGGSAAGAVCREDGTAADSGEGKAASTGPETPEGPQAGQDGADEAAGASGGGARAARTGSDPAGAAPDQGEPAEEVSR